MNRLWCLGLAGPLAYLILLPYACIRTVHATGWTLTLPAGNAQAFYELLAP